MRDHPYMVTIGFTLVSWGCAPPLVGLLDWGNRAAAPSPLIRAMAGLGQVSYAFYLWHAPVLVAGDILKTRAANMGHPVPLSLPIVLTFAASLGMAIATTRLIEAPVLR